MATNTRAVAVVLGADEEDALHWAEKLEISDPTAGPFRPLVTSRPARGLLVRRIYVTPAATTGRGFNQTLAELRIRMACTRGGDKTGPRFLQEVA